MYICKIIVIFINQLNDFFVSEGLHPITRKVRNYYNISIGRKEEIDYIYKNIYKESSYFLERKYDKFLVAYSESCRATLRKFS